LLSRGDYDLYLTPKIITFFFSLPKITIITMMDFHFVNIMGLGNFTFFYYGGILKVKG